MVDTWSIPSSKIATRYSIYPKLTIVVKHNSQPWVSDDEGQGQQPWCHLKVLAQSYKQSYESCSWYMSKVTGKPTVSDQRDLQSNDLWPRYLKNYLLALGVCLFKTNYYTFSWDKVYQIKN